MECDKCEEEIFPYEDYYMMPNNERLCSFCFQDTEKIKTKNI